MKISNWWIGTAAVIFLTAALIFLTSKSTHFFLILWIEEFGSLVCLWSKVFIWLILILEFVADYLISRDLKTPATHLEIKSRNNSCQRRSDTSSQRIRHVFKNSIAYHSRKTYRVYKIWGDSLKFLIESFL